MVKTINIKESDFKHYSYTFSGWKKLPILKWLFTRYCEFNVKRKIRKEWYGNNY